MVWMKLYRWLSIVFLPVIAAFAVSSCSISGVGISSEFEIVKEYDQGRSGTFTVKVSRTRLSTSEELTLVLEAKAAEQWRVAFPEIQDSLEKFRVVDRGMEMRRLDRDRNLIYTRSYTLEPFLSGVYAIPPLEISFGEQGGAYSFSLISDEIAVEVASVLPPLLGEQDIEGIWGPLGLQRRMIVWIVIAGIILAAAGAGLLYAGRRFPTFRSGVKALHPWETALKELDSLLAKKLIEHGRYREFYDGISDLTRRYVEQRFSIRAPEQTTEEFLQQVQDSNALSKYTPLLEEFLSGCDLVKFARYEPSLEEVERTVHTCESFLTGTVPRKMEI
jgi:hypothetical protein